MKRKVEIEFDSDKQHIVVSDIRGDNTFLFDTNSSFDITQCWRVASEFIISAIRKEAEF